MSSRIAYNILRVHPDRVNATLEFYTNVCGMKLAQTSDQEKRHHLNFPDNDQSCGIAFETESDFNSSPQRAGYWKVGFTLRDVDSAVQHFTDNNINVGSGSQFEDIGYLTHLKDPAGYSVELLQHDFEKNFTKPTCNGGILCQPKSHGPSLGQITIRSKDADATQTFYTDVLGMSLVSIQPVTKYGFTLYFFAYTNGTKPPNSSDFTAVENREWLWKQKFTQIEIQHRLSAAADYVTNDETTEGKIGHVGFTLSVSAEVYEKLSSLELSKIANKGEHEKLIISDPDGYRIEVTKST